MAWICRMDSEGFRAHECSKNVRSGFAGLHFVRIRWTTDVKGRRLGKSVGIVLPGAAVREVGLRVGNGNFVVRGPRRMLVAQVISLREADHLFILRRSARSAGYFGKANAT